MTYEESNDGSKEECDWDNHTLFEIMKKHECDLLFLKTATRLGRYAPYYDLDSYELLDEKIAVMTALLEGKSFYEIPDAKKILEGLVEIHL